MHIESDYVIPKKIHYCWFGEAPLGEKELACIDSWRTHMPDYEIVRWDESNFDITCCDYCKEAYEAGMWAFVSDYARFKVLYEHGGVYLDTDVEVIRSLGDLVDRGPFMGFQDDFGRNCDLVEGEGGCGTIAPGLGMAAKPGMSIYRSMLDYYESRHFKLDDDSCDVTNVVDITTDIMAVHGLREADGIQHVAGIAIYPAEYLNPKDAWTGEIHPTDHTYAIHHFSMSWLSPSQRAERRYTARLTRLGLKKQVAIPVSKLAAIARYLDVRRIVNIVRGRKSRN